MPLPQVLWLGAAGQVLVELNNAHRVKIIAKDRGFIEEQSVQATLLFGILQELQGIRTRLNEANLPGD